MNIQKRVEDQWKEAMKAKSASKDALSSIRSELKNRAIADRTSGGSSTETVVSDDTAMSVLGKMAKQRQDSITDYKAANRQDLVDKETLELQVIESFLPQKLSDAELVDIIKSTASEVGYSGQKDHGKFMKALMPKVKGRVDGKTIQQVVLTTLSSAT